jgi:exodeoxyribonuclease-1
VGFVFYDLETTGLDKRHDQIVQFAAIRTDDELVVKERAEFSCRLDPHVVPDPEALLLTRRSLADLCAPDAPSHYSAMCSVVRLLEKWSPATLVGFNSISFDEPMLHHAFYRTLHDPYLTSLMYVRADALTLCRAVAFYSPGALAIPKDEEGRPRFKLGMLYAANGGSSMDLHSAMADAEATLALCRLVRESDEETWSRFLQFSNKAAVAGLVDDGEPFGIVRFRGNNPVPAPAVVLGRKEGDANLRILLDLSCDLDKLSVASEEELAQIVAGPDSPMFELRINACPAVCNIWDLPQLARPGLDDAECEARCIRLAENARLNDRLLTAALAARREYPPSPHVEEQLYEKLPLGEDRETRRSFHIAPWEQRPEIIKRLVDPRTRRLGQRLLFLEAPHVLPEERRTRLAAESAARRRRGSEPVPWRTVEDALASIEQLGDDCPSTIREEFRAWL